MSTAKVNNLQHTDIATSSIRLSSDGSVSLYFGNNERIKAVTAGCEVTGTCLLYTSDAADE